MTVDITPEKVMELIRRAIRAENLLAHVREQERQARAIIAQQNAEITELHTRLRQCEIAS